MTSCISLLVQSQVAYITPTLQHSYITGVIENNSSSSLTEVALHSEATVADSMEYPRKLPYILRPPYQIP